MSSKLSFLRWFFKEIQNKGLTEKEEESAAKRKRIRDDFLFGRR